MLSGINSISFSSSNMGVVFLHDMSHPRAAVDRMVYREMCGILTIFNRRIACARRVFEVVKERN